MSVKPFCDLHLTSLNVRWKLVKVPIEISLFQCTSSEDVNKRVFARSDTRNIYKSTYIYN